MELVKIYKDDDFANAVIPEGAVLTYTAIEDGKVVTKFRDEKGEIGVIAGGNTEPSEPQIEYKGGYFVNNEDGTLTFMEVNEDTTTAEGVVTDVNIVDTGVDEPLYNTAKAAVSLGQINEIGAFQPLTFNGTEASNSGNPETVENYYGWNGVLPVPNNGIKVGEAAEYYKCASVDTVNKTWTGYLATPDDDGIYKFEATATEGLQYDKLCPVVGKIYTSDCRISVDYLFTGFPEYSTPVNPNSNTFGDWIIDASSEFDSSRKAYKAFTEQATNANTDGWHTGGESNPWIRWKNTKEPVLIKWYYVHFREDTIADGFILQGSLDGEIWETIDTVDNSELRVEITRELNNNNTAYSCHRLVFDRNNYLMVYNITAKSFY